LDAAHAELACREHAAATTGHAAQRLTPQERRVAEAVSHGGSTREVAEALVLSPRTVEFHLANVYRKLGVHNRAQLANVVAASGAPHPSSVSDRPSSP
jgi:DNA-binding NarL/FixJ family response regulator